MKIISKFLISSLILMTLVLTGCSSTDKNDPKYIMYSYASESGYDHSFNTWKKDIDSGDLNFRALNNSIEWKMKDDSNWDNLFTAQGIKPLWMLDLLKGSVGIEVNQYYSVSFETYNDDTLDTQIVLTGEKAVEPEALEKDSFIFNGWLNGKDSFDFDTTIEKQYSLEASWLIEGIHLDGFTQEEGYYTLDVDNHISSVKVSNYINTDSEWYLSTTENISDKIDSKLASVSVGVNIFYLISVGEEENTTYEIRIKRLDMFDVTFKLVYSNKEDETIKVGQYQENSKVVEESYNYKGYTHTTEYDFDTLVTSDITIVITFTPNKYDITFDVNGGELLNESTVEVDFDSTITLPITTKYRHTFLGWTYNNTLVSDEYLVTVDSNITLVAKWKQNDYFVDYELDGGTNSKSNPTGYDSNNDIIELFDAEKEGYEFKGWYSDVLFENKVEQIEANSSTAYTLYAKYEAKGYIITFNVDGGNPIDNLKVTYDASFELPTTSKSGLVFGGWYNDDVKVYSGIWTTTSNITLKAKWLDCDYTIDYKLNVGKNNEMNILGYDEGDLFNFLNPNNLEGYTFKGWYSDEACTILINGINAQTTGNLIIYGVFEANKYTITYDSQGADIEDDSIIVTFGDAYELEKPRSFGKKFIGWEYNGNIIDSSVWDIADNITVTPRWEDYDYTITYVCETNYNYENETGYFTGQQFELNDPSDKVGYDFDGWYLDNVKIESIAGNYGKDIELVAKFIPKTFEISFNTDGDVMDNLEVTYDEDFNLEDATKLGYEFKGWYLDGELFESGTWLLLEDIELVAKWEIIEYTITYHLNDSDNHNDNLDIYTVETEFSLLNPNRQFDNFDGWYIDANFESIYNGITLGETGDLVLFAKFTSIDITITYELNGGTMVVENTTNYSFDDGEVELKAAKITGFNFSYWCLDTELTTRVQYLTHDFIKDIYSEEGSTPSVTLYAKYTDEIVERITFIDVDHYNIEREYMYYGMYPQSVVSDSSLISNLNNITEVDSQGYLTYDGERYAKQLVNAYDVKYVYNDGTKVVLGQEAYFKVEYIKWRVLRNGNDEITLMADSILDVSVYQDYMQGRPEGGVVIYSNNYEYSTLRTFLNEDFLNKAFSEEQLKYLLKTDIDNSLEGNIYESGNTEDYVFALSLEELISKTEVDGEEVNDFGFTGDANSDLARDAFVTDYALANHAQVDNGLVAASDSNWRTGRWWLRTPSTTIGIEALVNQLNSKLHTQAVNDNTIGVRPTITIK